jgi:hypothetical protein
MIKVEDRNANTNDEIKTNNAPALHQHQILRWLKYKDEMK